MRVRQQGCVKSKICGERPWESIDEKQQAMNDVRQEGLTRTSIDPPCQRPGMGSFTVGYHAIRGKDPYRDNDRVIVIICIVMGKKDGKVHLYGHTMIGRTILQQGKFNKRRNHRNRCKQKRETTGAAIDTRVGKGGTPV
jgi:hypothetical protein